MPLLALALQWHALASSAPPSPPPAPAASLRFSTAYGSHMVLQQAPKTAVVWGYCAPARCADVKVTLAAEGKKSATGHALTPQIVDAQPGGSPGTFIAKLPATDGGPTPHTVTVTDGAATATLRDVVSNCLSCAMVARCRLATRT
jgi:hypothetical protein